MLHDPKFWLAISFIIFVLLMLKYVFPIIIGMIDNKAAQIANSLKEAQEMKKQAEKLLKMAQKYHDESVKQSDQLIKDAKAESDKIINDHDIALKDEINKKLAAADERLNSQEDRIIREIKDKIIESAIIAIEDNIGKVTDDQSFNEATQNSINQISSKLIN